MSNEEERDLKRMQELDIIIKNDDNTAEQHLEASAEFFDILAKYEPLNVQRLFRLQTLNALEALRELVAKKPSNAEEKKVHDEAKRTLEYYENFLFPPWKASQLIDLLDCPARAGYDPCRAASNALVVRHRRAVSVAHTSKQRFQRSRRTTPYGHPAARAARTLKVAWRRGEERHLRRHAR
jgi:hypothetical protein